MKRILINATHNEEIRVALCKDNHLYDFDLENRTREQKKANIYKGHVTRVEPSLEAVFVEYGSARQGFLPLREIAPEYLKGNPRNDNIRELIKEGDEVIIQIEKEERGNKGAAVSTFISLAGRYLVLMPNNHKAGGISRQISGKVREEMKQIINSLSIPQGMSVIVRTAGIGKGFEDLQNDLNHLLTIWASILEQNRTRPSPCLIHQEAGVVTRAVRDYLRDDIGEIWIDSENAYNEAANFIASVMPNQMGKLRKYTDYEPLFVRFGIERQIESAYQREVRLPSGGSIVIDQTEALVSIDINSSKSTKGSDVAETAFHTNLEAAEEIARQLRLRDMGGLIVIDFIDMNDPTHQKEVEKRLIDATRYDRARVQFAEISKFGLMEMSRQRLRPSLEESTGYLCPRCHGNGMIRDLRSLALSIMRQVEQIALQERTGEIQVEVPIEVSAFLLNEKRESLVYLEQDSGVRVTILPHAHLESPNFSLHFNPDGFAPASYERVADTEERESVERGYDVNWQTKHEDTPKANSRWQQANSHTAKADKVDKADKTKKKPDPIQDTPQPQAVAWLSNLFAPKPQAKLAHGFGSQDIASAIETLVNDGATSLGSFGNLALNTDHKASEDKPKTKKYKDNDKERSERTDRADKTYEKTDKVKPARPTDRADKSERADKTDDKKYPKREAGSQRPPRGEIVRGETLELKADKLDKADKPKADKVEKADKADKFDKVEKKERAPKAKADKVEKADKEPKAPRQKSTNPNEVMIHISAIEETHAPARTVHLSLDGSKEKSKAHEAESTVNDTHAHAEATTPEQTDNVETIQATTPSETVATPAVEVTEVAQNTETTQTIEAVETPTADDRDKVITHEEAKKAIRPAPAVVRAKLPTPAPMAFEPSHLAKVELIAHEQGRALNDPRVLASVMSNPAPTIITGTAGEFVRATLGETAGESDFVARFLLALNTHRTPTETAFDFANYGFAPLGEAYLTIFAQYVQPQGQFDTPQGKTAVAPRPIGERAINDPRGAYVPPVVENTQTAEVEITPTQNEVENASPTEVAEKTVETAEVVKVAEVEEVVETETAQAEATQTETPNATPEAEPVSEPNSEPQNELDPMQQMFDSAESAIESLVHTLEEIIKPTTDKKGKKDKASSYKDMIENVSGQLLPPMGILSLVAPKKPKATKPKTPKTAKATNRKITQKAQNAQVVKKSKTEMDGTDSETGGENPVGE